MYQTNIPCAVQCTELVFLPDINPCIISEYAKIKYLILSINNQDFALLFLGYVAGRINSVRIYYYDWRFLKNTTNVQITDN